ncbi:hypothetical protein [Streptomyces sp. H34-S4]|uniref:hypothetical protein n=1 Tax=Streptomyces sp. H34-S4 TaxID=2996463 RepID=UPI0022712349|nr:hypothetical protein [Streptomyces sp. H34-S4]MCY0936113.1 hypothetical protein [Streptomyces sp. H34-S4]
MLTCHAHHPRTGYWLETVSYRDAYDSSPELHGCAIANRPEDAIRLIRIQIQTGHPITLSPSEAERALAWACGGGRVQALAALHRGEGAGFSIVQRDGTRAEWRIRPVSRLRLIRSG